MGEDTKECQFCAETIKAAAKKCKHCGEMLDREPAAEPRRSQAAPAAPAGVVQGPVKVCCFCDEAISRAAGTCPRCCKGFESSEPCGVCAPSAPAPRVRSTPARPSAKDPPRDQCFHRDQNGKRDCPNKQSAGLYCSKHKK
jgi:predicted amidophosphoribosyltransferase